MADDTLVNVDQLSWYEPRTNEPQPAPRFDSVEPFYSQQARGREILKVAWQGRDWLLKTRLITLRKWRRARSRTAFAAYEAQVTRDAHEAGLPVSQCPLWAERRRFGMPVAQAVLLAYTPEFEALDKRVQDAADAGDQETLAAARQAIVSLFSRMRAAGFADRDFNGTNILVSPGWPDNATDEPTLIWIDLESAYREPQGNLDASFVTLAPLMVWWWSAIGEDERRYRQLWMDLGERYFQPVTPGHARATDQYIRKLARRFQKKGYIDDTPPPL